MPHTDWLVAPDAPAPTDEFRPGGVALHLDAPAMSAGPAAMERFLGQLTDVVSQGLPLAVRIGAAGEACGAARSYFRCCEQIARAFADASLDPGSVEITVSAADIAPDVAFAVRSHMLGVGRLNVLIDESTLAATEQCMRLWRLRNEPNVRAAFWPVAESGCPLLGAEEALEVNPVAGLQSPPNSAWQIAELDLASLVDPATGRLRSSHAQRVASLVCTAEHCHEVARWPTAAMRQDAWLNRRVAIRLVGIGDAVRRCGMDPAGHETLRAVRGWVGAIRESAESGSRTLATQAGLLPAIAACSPCRDMRQGQQRVEWERRWLRAVRYSAVRHRNLIAMSPWSLLPSSSADIAYVNLMPVLADTDVCSCERGISIASWNINKFRRFYERALAVLDTVTGGVVIAEGP